MISRLRSATRLITLAALALPALLAGQARAEDAAVCAPQKMVKIITTAEIPGASRDPFARAPKTVYRQGTRFGRVEEGFNPNTNLKLLIVVDEPHLWVSNLATAKGQYIRDAGPTYNFRARLFGDGAVSTAFARGLEYGCELEGMRRAGAKATDFSHPALGQVKRLEAGRDNERVVLYTGRNDRPVQLELHIDDRLVYVLNYEDYQTGLEFDASLFKKPSGIEFDREPTD
jgi:hypothetical protein